MAITLQDPTTNENGFKPFYWGTSKAIIANKAFTVNEALAKAKLDFTVSKTELGAYTPRTGGSPRFTKADGLYVTSRDDTGDILGSVGKDYQVFQNREALNLASDIVDSGEANVKVMGDVKGGKKTFMVLELPSTGIRVAGIEDERINTYLTIVNAHTGGQSVTAYIGAERAVCANMLSYGFKNAAASFRVRHTLGMRDRLGIMSGREMLGITVGYMAEWEAAMTKLLADKYTDRRVDDFLKRLLPTPENALTSKTLVQADGTSKIVPMRNRGVKVAEETRAAIRAIYSGADNLGNVRGTAYGLLNAVNEYALHHVEGRITAGRDEDRDAILAANRFERVLAGVGLDHTALPMLLSVAR